LGKSVQICQYKIVKPQTHDQLGYIVIALECKYD